MGGVCSTYGKKSGVYRDLVENTKGKRPLRRPRRTWEDNIKMHLQEVRSEEWIELIWLRIGTGGGYL
jgi:hypothetical protein